MERQVQELLAQLEREKQLREIAEGEAEKERQLRREEQRRREEAEDLQHEERRRRRVVEELQREEQRRREEAEADLEPTTLPSFLRACHKLLLAIDIVTDPTRTTQGAVTKPTNRMVPSRITIWDTFIEEQMTVWEKLNDHASFFSEKLFPSRHQLMYVRQLITPITSEWDLRYYERDTVENHVRRIVDQITENKDLKDALGLQGSVTFESHTNLGKTEGVSVKPTTETGPSTTAKSNTQSKKSTAITRGQADQFCIYRQEGNAHIPAIAIEYKAPHKLTQAEIEKGLAKEIQPIRDVVGQESDDVEFCCRRLVAAVITQLFSYMVQKGIRYGYVCTGESFIFVYIPGDPNSVQCALCKPQEVKKDNLQLTAVAQVLAFTIRALTALPISQTWYDTVSELDVWPVEYSEILEQTPPTARLKQVSPLYRGRQPRNLPPFGMTLRSRCRSSEDERRLTSSSSSSPSPSFSLALSRPGIRGQTQKEGTAQSGSDRNPGESSGHKEAGGTKRVYNSIYLYPYCSQRCLLALKDGGPLDPLCPNYQDHQKGRINVEDFRSSIRTQLATDRGYNPDCGPVYKPGSCGQLFKVRLSLYGYTLVAKGVEYQDLYKLEHELRVYNQLRDLQGECVPVCLGIVELTPGLPQYFDGGVYTHMLFLSWAGESIRKDKKSGYTLDTVSTAYDALKTIHSKGVLHGDAEPRNILWNPIYQRVMIVDFERATIRRPLSDVSVNPARKKRRLMATCFNKELQGMKAALGGDVAWPVPP
ncbi:hypothetical protein MferCBS31731_003449 [Microsporum ferrugineum]